MSIFFFNDPATTEIYTLPLHDALPILANIDPAARKTLRLDLAKLHRDLAVTTIHATRNAADALELRQVEAKRSEEHTSELPSQSNLVFRLLLETKKQANLLHLILLTTC